MAIKNIDGDVKVEFTEPAQRQTLDSGESAKTLFGKISKWLRDLKAVAFSGSYNDLDDKPNIPVYSAGNGMTLSGTSFNVGKRWTAVTRGRTWSRIYLATPVLAVQGSSGILSISCTRAAVVVNATFLITASHSSKCQIVELASTEYTAVRCRAVVETQGTYYFEIYDTAKDITSGTEQIWQCCFIPILDTELTVYTAFANGSSIPSGYRALNDFTTTIGSAGAAIKNITRSGNTFTATRQDGSTFTFDQNAALATNATVTLDGAVAGTSNFSNNVATINTKRKSCVAGNNSGTISATPYYKVASLKGSLTVFKNYRLALYVQQAYESNGAVFGILDIDIRTETGPVVRSINAKWLISASGINPEDFMVVHDKTAGSIDIYCKCYGKWQLYRFVVLSESEYASEADKSDVWTLYNVASGIAELPTGDNIVIAYSSLAGVNTSMTGYSKPLSTSAIATTDTLNEAIGKLEKGLDNKANTADIPTVNDGTLTIQQNGTTKATFTANQNGDTNVNIETGDAYGIDMYDGTLPIDITARGDDLEDWVIYGNNEPGKNLVNLANVQSITYGGITWTIDATNGIVTANGKLTTTFSIITLISPTNLSQYNGCYLSCDTQNVFSANINIRDSISYAILVQAKSNESVLIDNIPTTNCYVQLAIEGHIDDVVDNLIFKPMIRAANTTPDFDPYHLGVGQLNSAGTGYELPIVTKQTGKTDITTNIYLGASPLTEGQSLSKEQATTKDIPTYNGECVIDTSYPNKPKMEIIPTDSAINIINRLRRTSARNSNNKTERFLYSPDRDNGIYADVRDNTTIIQFACGQASNANGKVVFLGDRFYGGIGNPTSDSVNHFKFNDDCAGDSIGKLSGGAALSGSTLDLWYETIRFNGKAMDMFAHSGQSHNCIWRGKYIGDTFTAAQKAAIADGSFDDLFVGDYWTINWVDWVVADINYYYGFGDTACWTNHLVIVPRRTLIYSKMNDTNTATGAYVGSKMKTEVLLCNDTTKSDTNTIYGKICAAFGESNILEHRVTLSNGVNSGKASSWSWYSSKVDLLNQTQINGQSIWTNSGYVVGLQNSQLAAFRLNHNFLIAQDNTTKYWYWLSDVISNAGFGVIDSGGNANTGTASNSYGVRPHFCLCG